MRKCPNCGEMMDEVFEACWKCGTEFDRYEFTESPQSSLAEQFSKSEAADCDESYFEQQARGMSRLEVAQLICKAIALALFAWAGYLTVTSTLLIVSDMSHSVDKEEALFRSMVLLIPGASLIVIGFVYWAHSAFLANHMVSRVAVPATSFSVGIQDVMIVAFSTLGVLVLVEAVLDLVNVVRYAYLGYFLSGSEGIWTNHGTWAAVARAAIAAWLILGASGIARAVLWLRGEPSGIIEAE